MTRIVCFLLAAIAVISTFAATNCLADPTAYVINYNSAYRTAAINGTDGAAIIYDDYVPNTGVNNGPIAAYASSFTGFVNPATSAEAVGIVISETDGEVLFYDSTSKRVTSDIWGPQNGNSITIEFVDPSDGTTPAAVTAVGFYIGRPPANSVTAEVFDVDGNLLGSRLLPDVGLSSTTSIAWVCRDEEIDTAAIHSIVFTNTSDIPWLLGSWIGNSAYEDMYFTGVEIVPEPATIALLAMATGALLKRRR